VQRRIDDEARACHQQRVAVRRRIRRLGDADIAARAADVLDIKILVERLGQVVRQQAPHDVDDAAGRERDDHLHRSRGIAVGRNSLCAGRRCGRQHDRAEDEQGPKAV
jgi:hypothetical protein